MNSIIIFLKDKNIKTNLLIDFLKSLLGNINIIINNDNLIINYKENEEINFSEIANMIINDFYIDITLLEIKSNNIDYVDMIINMYNQLEKKYIYLNDKKVLSLNIKYDNELIKKEILKEYYNDSEMLHTIKVFLEHDLNTSIASNVLYLHRNTLINKLDKFVRVTGYDIRKFVDANIIYQLIN